MYSYTEILIATYIFLFVHGNTIPNNQNTISNPRYFFPNFTHYQVSEIHIFIHTVDEFRDFLGTRSVVL